MASGHAEGSGNGSGSGHGYGLNKWAKVWLLGLTVKDSKLNGLRGLGP